MAYTYSLDGVDPNGLGGAIDPATGKPVRKASSAMPGSVAYADDTYDLGYSPGDITRAQNAGAKQAGVAAGIGAAAQLGQLGLTFVNTAQDKKNKERLAELESTRKGLSADERRVAEDTMMNPVRAMATESRQKNEASLAAMGGSSVADLTRVRRESERRVGEAGVQAGANIAKLDLDAAAAQRAEEESRRSYESSRARQRIEMLGQTLAKGAEMMGPVLASSAVKTAPQDADLVRMQGAKRGDGTPVYPGLQGLSLDQIRANWEAEQKGEKTGVFAGGVVAPS